MTGTNEEAQRNQSSSTSSPNAREPNQSRTPSPSSITIAEKHSHQPTQSSATSSSSPQLDEETKKWGTHIMGAPAVPSVHPDNQKAAFWRAADHQEIYHQPYVVYSPVDKPSHNPFEPVIHMFNTWSTKAETIARNIWHNRKFEFRKLNSK